MKYYPVNLDVAGQKCLVVGGGGVGTRKVKTLVKCGACVTVVSLTFSDKLKAFANDHDVTLHEKEYETSDLEAMFLVIGATDNEKLNWKISKDAKKFRVLCNIADFPAACDFILPSIVNRGDLSIAISTSGRSPAFAKKIRKALENQFGEEYADFLCLMGAVRKKLLSEAHEPEAHKPLFEQMIENNLLQCVKEKDTKKIDELLFEILGEGYRYNDLMDMDKKET